MATPNQNKQSVNSIDSNPATRSIWDRPDPLISYRRRRDEVDRLFLERLDDCTIERYAKEHGIHPGFSKRVILGALFRYRHTISMLSRSKANRRFMESFTDREIRRYARGLGIDDTLERDGILSQMFSIRPSISLPKRPSSLRRLALENTIIKREFPGQRTQTKERATDTLLKPFKRRISLRGRWWYLINHPRNISSEPTVATPARAPRKLARRSSKEMRDIWEALDSLNRPDYVPKSRPRRAFPGMRIAQNATLLNVMTQAASGANPSARRRRLPTPEEFERARKASATSSHHQAQCQSTFGDSRLRRSSSPVVNEPGANCVQEQASIRHDDIVTDKLAKAAIPETTMMHSKITRSQNAVPHFTEPPSDDPEPVASRKRGGQDNGNEQDRGHYKRSRVCVAPAEERLQPDQMQSAGPLAILPDPDVSRKRGRQDGDGSSTSQSFQAGNRPHKRRNLGANEEPR